MEMLVVLAILAVLSAGAVGYLRPQTPSLARIESEAQHILRKARMQAITSARDVAVRVEDGVLAVDGQAHFALPETTTVAVLNGPTLRFHGAGGATGGGLKLQQGETSTTISVHWLTGKIGATAE